MSLNQGPFKMLYFIIFQCLYTTFLRTRWIKRRNTYHLDCGSLIYTRTNRITLPGIVYGLMETSPGARRWHLEGGMFHQAQKGGKASASGGLLPVERWIIVFRFFRSLLRRGVLSYDWAVSVFLDFQMTAVLVFIVLFIVVFFFPFLSLCMDKGRFWVFSEGITNSQLLCYWLAAVLWVWVVQREGSLCWVWKLRT